MVDVEGRGRVAELPEDVQEAGRVGAAGDQAQDVAPRRDQVVAADVALDVGAESFGIDCTWALWRLQPRAA